MQEILFFLNTNLASFILHQRSYFGKKTLNKLLLFPRLQSRVLSHNNLNSTRFTRFNITITFKFVFLSIFKLRANKILLDLVSAFDSLTISILRFFWYSWMNVFINSLVDKQKSVIISVAIYNRKEIMYEMFEANFIHFFLFILSIILQEFGILYWHDGHVEKNIRGLLLTVKHKASLPSTRTEFFNRTTPGRVFHK